MCDIIGSTTLVVAIAIICVVFAFLFLPAVSQSNDTTYYSYRPGPYIPDTLYRSDDVGKKYGVGVPWGTKVNSNITGYGNITHNETETGGGAPFRIDKSIIMSQGIFEVNPSLFLDGEGEDSRYSVPFGVVFSLDDYLKDDQEKTEVIENRSLVEEMLISERLKTLTEVSVHQFDVLPTQERKTYNPSHDTLSDRLAVYPESPEEPALQRSYRIPGIDPVEKGYGDYDINSDLKEGGNIKLPLSVRGLREEKDHMGILPDTIYVGTDFDYRGMAQSLTSWRSGNGTLSSDLNRIGSEWMDKRSGYIYFEWQLWE